MEKQEEQGSEKKLALTRLHFFYIVLILLGSLILMATRDWTKLDGFTDYLSVSATITSLVVGVLAIIYGYISSNSTNSSLGSVQAAAHEMKNVGFQLTDLLSKGQELQKKAETRNDELHELIGNLRSTIDNLTTSTTHIAGTVEMLPVKIDSLRNEIFEKNTDPTTSAPKAAQETGLQSNQIQQFLSVSSIIGLAALKALVEAKRLTKPADLEKIFKNDYFDSTGYAQGYLVASSCLGVIEFEIESGSKRVVKISISQDSEELIQSEWTKRENSGDESSKKSIKKYLDMISSSFSPQQAAEVN